jgi:hypothetical protein
MCSGYNKIVLHRLVIEANDSLYTTLTHFKQLRRFFYTGQNYDGLTPKRTNYRRSGLRSDQNIGVVCGKRSRACSSADTI